MCFGVHYSTPGSNVPNMIPRTPGLLPRDGVPASDFARQHGFSLQSLHRWRLQPVDPLPAMKVGGRWWVSEAEFAEWVQARSSPTRKSRPTDHATQRSRAEREVAVRRAIAECHALGV